MKLIYLFLLIIVSFIIGWFSSSGIKSQLIRLLDIILYGPILIWISTKIETTWIQILLVIMGATTMSYNARNLNYNSVKNSSITNPASW